MRMLKLKGKAMMLALGLVLAVGLVAGTPSVADSDYEVQSVTIGDRVFIQGEHEGNTFREIHRKRPREEATHSYNFNLHDIFDKAFTDHVVPEGSHHHDFHYRPRSGHKPPPGPWRQPGDSTGYVTHRLYHQHVDDHYPHHHPPHLGAYYEENGILYAYVEADEYYRHQERERRRNDFDTSLEYYSYEGGETEHLLLEGELFEEVEDIAKDLIGITGGALFDW